MTSDEFQEDAKLIGGLSMSKVKQIPPSVLRDNFRANPEGINQRPAVCDTLRKSVSMTSQPCHVTDYARLLTSCCIK